LPEDLFDQLEDEPLDLLDRYKTRSALRSTAHLKRKQESDDDPEIDSEGRLIVREGGKPKKEKLSNPDSDARSEAGSFKSLNSKKTQKRRKTSNSGWAYTGSEYASKKAGGDVKRKDKLEPYAYWPLDRKMMSRRPEHRAAARKGMASVVKMTKKLEGKSASAALSMKIIKSNSQKKGNKRKSR
jgi:ribosomal RNA-processing protein 12